MNLLDDQQTFGEWIEGKLGHAVPRALALDIARHVHELATQDAFLMMARRASSSRDKLLAAAEGWRKEGRDDLAEQSATGADELDKIVFSAMVFRRRPDSRGKWKSDETAGVDMSRWLARDGERDAKV